MFRWLFRITITLVGLGVASVGLAYYFAARSLPDYDQRLHVEGIAAPVEIVRNNVAIPHIFGQSDADVFFGLGYAHAQDRLWQMVMLRRTVQGRLSELFGRRTLAIDSLLRRLDLYPLAVAAVKVQDSYARAALDAYAAGVNARIDEVNRKALGRGAPEFFVFSEPIPPWKPADSIAIVKLMALQLSGHMRSEIRRALVSAALPDPARLKDILPDAPGRGDAALPSYSALFPDLPRRQAAIPPTDPLNPVAPPERVGASNAWAAAATRSAAGGALLAGDPHLGFTAPSIWYLARLELASGGVIGATIPGVPAVLLGRNRRLGWSITSSYMDDQDLHVEQLDPDNPERYRTPSGWAPFATRRAIVRIKGEPPVTLALRWTENGPVLPPGQFGIGAATPPGHVMSLSWTALTPEDTSLSAALALMQAGSVDAAIAAGSRFVAPSQNLIVADSSGRIALKTIGRMPRRDASHQTRGRMPSPGWLEINRWKGFYPYSANPGFVNPPGGIVANTNNKTVERPFPLHVSYEWGDTQRIHRLKKLLQRREVHTRESFIEAQLDTVSFTARTLLPLVAAELWFTAEAAPRGTPERLRQDALALLSEWNGEMDEHRPEPLIYAAWMRALQQRLIRDELGALADSFSQLEPLFIERVFRDVDGAAVWCDVIQSSEVESCARMAELALDDALVWIAETYGTQLDSLRWGDAHQATHDHQVLGDVPVLGHLLNIRQSTGGGDNTLNRGRTLGTGPDPFLNVHGAGYRGVYDFADPDSSVFIIATGQSGHPLSRHYDDLGVLWRRGEYVPMSLDVSLARAAAEGITWLLPAEARGAAGGADGSADGSADRGQSAGQ